MRYLAIDPGSRRTGIALGDDILRQASPIDVIHTGDADQRLREIQARIDEYGPDALVLGIPYNMDGSTGPAATAALALAEQLETETGLPVHRVDERLTSYAADGKMAGSGRTHQQKKNLRDALAAAVILQDYLNSQ